MNDSGSEDLELSRLRQTTRDLVALTTLPAIWGGLHATGVVDSLASALLKTLDLDFISILVAGSGDSEAIEVMRTRQEATRAADLALVRAALHSPSVHAKPDTAARPAEGPHAPRLARFPLGIASSMGTIVAGSWRPGFPTENDRLLLGVGANQAVVVLQRQQAERALRRSESKFLDFANGAPAMLWVTEPDGSCSFLSQRWYEFTGLGKDTGLGYGWTGAIHPDDREHSTQAFMTANARQQPFSSEHRLRHSDGSYRWVIDAGSPRFSADGAFLGFVGNVLDITDRRRTEQALHEARALLSAVFEALPVGVAVADQAGTPLLSNHAMKQFLLAGVPASLDHPAPDGWHAFHADGERCAPADFPAARALRGERVPCAASAWCRALKWYFGATMAAPSGPRWLRYR